MFLRSNLLDDVNFGDTAVWCGDVVVVVVVVVVPIVVAIVVVPIAVVAIVVVVVVPIVVAVAIVVVDCSHTHRLAKEVHVEAGHRKAAAIEDEEADTEPKSMEEVLVVQVRPQIQPGSPNEYGLQRELHL